MKQLIITIIALNLAVSGFTQDGRILKSSIYKIAVNGNPIGNQAIYLSDITDSALLIQPDRIFFRHTMLNSSTSVINYRKIEKMTIWRKGRVGRGILYGGLGGIIIGGIVGGISYRECPECWFDPGVGSSIGAGATVGAIGGMLIGGVMGALTKKTFIIGGNKEKFDQMKMTVLDKAYRQ